MNSILDLVLSNQSFNLWDLALIKCVDRSCKKIVDTIYPYVIKEVKKNIDVAIGKELFCERKKFKSSCVKCGEKTKIIYPFSQGKLHCVDCREMFQITKTEAKRTYKLKDVDLQKLDYSSAVHFLYGTRITYYSRKHVVAFCLLKHDGFFPTKCVSLSKEKRIKQIEVLKTKYGDIPPQLFENYVNSGTGGIRNLEKCIRLNFDIKREK